MDMSLRLRLSIMMFLQYFVWGAWAVPLVTYLLKSPVDGGLAFPGEFVGWIYATTAIGAMISPIFIGMFADRLFATEKVLGVLHLAGAALLGWAAFSCDQHYPSILNAFEAAAKAENIVDINAKRANLLDVLKEEKEFQKRIDEADPNEREPLRRRLEGNQRNISQPALERVNNNPELIETVDNTYFLLLGIMVAYALCYMPTITLSNSLSFRNLPDPDKYFGGIRVLGTIGWIVAGLVVGFGMNAVSAEPLYLAAAASAVLGVFSFCLPYTPPSGETKTLGETLGLPALAMFKDPSFAVFCVCSFLITIVLAFYYSFANKFLDDIQAPNPTALQTIGQVSEIFFMLLIPVGLARLGTKAMLVIGMLAWCARYATFASLNLPMVIAIGLPLHGICFDFFFVVSYLYVDRKAPSDLRASAQGIITFITLGVGMFLGNLLAGHVQGLYTRAGKTDWTGVWLVPLVGSAVATLLFAVLFREPRAPTVPATTAEPFEGLEPIAPPEQVH
jgi:nucleoside transporter